MWVGEVYISANSVGHSLLPFLTQGSSDMPVGPRPAKGAELGLGHCTLSLPVH